MNIRLEKEKVLCIQYNIMNLALRHTDAYITDLVLDFDMLNELNKEGFVDDIIFISRTSGCELGYADSPRITYYLEPLTTYPNEKNLNIKVYKIDITKLNSTQDVTWCTNLFNNKGKYDMQFNCIEQIFTNQTNNFGNS